MTSEGLGEMFKGDSADTCSRKFSPSCQWGVLVGICDVSHYRELISPGMSIPLYRGDALSRRQSGPDRVGHDVVGDTHRCSVTVHFNSRI